MYGVLAALTAAFFWTISSSIWRLNSRGLSSIQLNLIKNSIASILFLPVFIFIPWLTDFRHLSLLIISGIIGISFGDSFYFAALKRLGSRRTLTVEALAPIIASISGSIFIGELISTRSLVGSLLVCTSILIIAKQPSTGLALKTSSLLPSQWQGMIYALLSVVCGVIGALLSRNVFINSSLIPIQTSAIRVLGGLLFFLICLIIRRELFAPLKINSDFNWRLGLLSTFLGTNLAILCQQIVFQNIPVGPGITLLSTTPVWALFLSKIESDRLDLSGVLSSFLAVTGVGMVLW